MKINSFEVIMQNSETGLMYDISNIVGGTFSYTSQIEKVSSKVTFDVALTLNKLQFPRGSTISVKVNGRGFFFGYIFKVQFKDEFSASVTAYDQTRYLKNKGTYSFSGVTMEYIFKKICTDYQLRIGTVNTSGFILPQYLYDNKALGDILQTSLDLLLANKGRYFIIRDEFGQLCLRDLNLLKTTIVIGDNSLLQSYTFDVDIDSDTFNQVKLLKDNQSTGKRDAYITKDTNNIKRWGLLQETQVISEDYNSAQMKQRADMIHQIKNRQVRKLKLSCEGNLNVREGNGVYLQLSEIPEISFNQYVVVTQVTHNFSKMNHTMDLDVMFE